VAPPDPDLVYKFAYDEAVRALVEQQSVIDGLRSRAGLLLSAAAITTSFLGARSLDPGELGLAGWLATACFVGVALVSLIILWPRRWEFEADPREMIAIYVDAAEPASVGRLCRNLSLQMHNSYVENRGGLRQLVAFSQVAICLLTTEVILWVIALATHM
jgi:hypothetical protein